MRACDSCFAWPGTHKHGDLKLCDDCNRKYRVRRTGNVVEVLPR